VLITRGAIPGGNGNSDSELYVPTVGEFSPTARLTTPRSAHSSTLLPDGTVLIAGGYSVWPNATASAEIYRPRSPQGAIQHAGTHQVVSAQDSAKLREILAIYCLPNWFTSPKSPNSGTRSRPFATKQRYDSHMNVQSPEICRWSFRFVVHPRNYPAV
jgi:hypothetical protein